MAIIKALLALLLLLAAWAYGVAVGHYQVFPAAQLASLRPYVAAWVERIRGAAAWDRAGGGEWSGDFQRVGITSTADATLQNAYFRKSKGATRPLIVSLHTWSGDYSQHDPLAAHVQGEDWNYIRPDFRGANRSFDACLSDKALQDIDDAIAYAMEAGSVDRANIFVVGVSGGGHAALGNYLRSKHSIKAHLAWVPVSDLKAWYLQSMQSGREYARQIIDCTSRTGEADFDEMIRRSPLHWTADFDERKRLEIYAGIHDGYTGSVPISHSIAFFNKMAGIRNDVAGKIGETELLMLMSRQASPTGRTIDGRDVLFRKSTGNVSLIVFQGGHEMLVGHTVQRIRELVKQPAPAPASR